MYIGGGGIGGGGDSGVIQTTSVTDPAVNAAVTTVIVDSYDGVIITLTVAGNSQTIEDPTETSVNREFMLVNSDTSTSSITVNSVVIAAGKIRKFFWDGSSWLAVGTDSVASITRKTELAITGTIAAGTTFSTSTSGVNYTHSGDIGDIGVSSSAMNSSFIIQFERNGVRLDKTDAVTWISNSLFSINIIVDNGDAIVIFT